jgi:uncharacterized protein
MDPIALLTTCYPPGSPAREPLLQHSARVAAKAVAVARRLTEPVDITFVEEAAWLHDIGILHTASPKIGCFGSLPYICHGIKGREMLEAEGLPRHALVCERHIGVGLTVADIDAQGLPLPRRDMVPCTLEEQIVAYADLFFSKSPRMAGRERSASEVRETLGRYGAAKCAIFDAWRIRFGD